MSAESRLTLATSQGSLALPCPMGANLIFGSSSDCAAIFEGPGIQPRHFMVRRVGVRRFHISSSTRNMPCVVNGVSSIDMEADTPFRLTLGGEEIVFALEDDELPQLSSGQPLSQRRRGYLLGAPAPARPRPAPVSMQTEEPAQEPENSTPAAASVPYLPPPPPPLVKATAPPSRKFSTEDKEPEGGEITLTGILILILLTILGTSLFIYLNTSDEDIIETPIIPVSKDTSSEPKAPAPPPAQPASAQK